LDCGKMGGGSFWDLIIFWFVVSVVWGVWRFERLRFGGYVLWGVSGLGKGKFGARKLI